MLVKLDHFPKVQGESSKKIFELPEPSIYKCHNKRISSWFRLSIINVSQALLLPVEMIPFQGCTLPKTNSSPLKTGSGEGFF